MDSVALDHTQLHLSRVKNSRTENELSVLCKSIHVKKRLAAIVLHLVFGPEYLCSICVFIVHHYRA